MNALRLIALAVGGSLAAVSPLVGQQLAAVTGYSLTVPTLSATGSLSEGGAALLETFRLMAAPVWGHASLEVAYQQNLQLRELAEVVPGGSIFVPTSSKWLPLQWTIVEDKNVLWVHSFDRLAVAWSGANWEAVVGRQTISWATTLFLTPADPFAPFDPTDPFREYRAGVDAARVSYYPGPLSEVEAVVRLADTPEGTAVTALARGEVTWGTVDVSAWVGMIYDGPGLALAATGSVGSMQLRGEASLREEENGKAVLRLAIGADRRFTLAGRDLYLVLEYQHDGFGAANAGALVPTILSPPFQRGEMQVLGEDEIALSGSWQIHPLWAVDLTSLINLRDGSGLVIPAGSYSVGTDVSLRAGVYLSYGDGAVDLASATLGSEYGIVTTSAYASISWFF